MSVSGGDTAFTDAQQSTTLELDFTEGMGVKILNNPLSFRFWTIEVSIDSGTAQLSNIFLGESFAAPTEMRSPSYGWRALETDRSTIQRGFYAQPFVEKLNNEREFSMGIGLLKNETFENFRRMVDHLGKTRPLFFVADYTGVIINDPLRFACYGLIRQSPALVNRFFATYDSRLEIREVI